MACDKYGNRVNVKIREGRSYWKIKAIERGIWKKDDLKAKISRRNSEKIERTVEILCLLELKRGARLCVRSDLAKLLQS